MINIILKDRSNQISKPKSDEEEEEDDEDEDEIFETPPSTTPPNNEQVSFNPDDIYSSLYSTFDLHLNELQIIIGRYNSDNLQTHLSKGHSSLHLLEKFDIHIQIDLLKLKSDDKDTAPLNINLSLGLLRLHVDDLKLISIYRTIENIQQLFSKIDDDDDYDEEDEIINKEFLEQNSLCQCDLKSMDETSNSILCHLELKVDEVDVTMSITEVLGSRQSVAELKIFTVNAEFTQSSIGSKLLRFKIFSLLLIDARQLYGTDYNLLAASHSQLELDSKTGLLMDRQSPPRFKSRVNSSDTNSHFNPLINIDLEIKPSCKCSSKHKELNLKFSFSTLDLILNPETISEIIVLFYGTYLNISDKPINKVENTNNNSNNSNKAQLLYSNRSSNRMKINFYFSRLSVLIFSIEDLEKAKKVALFVLNGASVDATIVPEKKYLEVISKIRGVKVIDLKAKTSTHKIIFGIGVQNDEATISDSVIEIVYKKSVEFDGNEVSEIKAEVGSVCYLHSPELIFDIQRLFKDLMRFHEKIIQDLTEKAASLLKLGTDYLQSKIVDICQKETKSQVKVRLMINLQTPVIAIPMKAGKIK